MKHILALIIFASLFFIAEAQESPKKYWIYFTDKCEASQTDFRAESYFSPASIDRRSRQGIGYDAKDIPVCPEYVSTLNNAGLEVIRKSRWLNAVSVRANISSLNSFIASDPSWLKSISPVKKIKTAAPAISDIIESEKLMEESLDDYGVAQGQIHLHRGDVLHQQGFRGENMIIALMDGGYNMADKLPAFSHIFEEGRFLGGYDFVNDTSYVFASSGHGTSVWGCMAGSIESEYLGTAPNASYYLFITEDVGSESLIEEDNWVAAGEFADSVGAHITNTSLGYSTFDDSLENHIYADLDGNTTPISIAADVAASKGILVFNSAGNSGNSSWQYITAPADADSCIAVAAVNSEGIRASFSSKGPSSDGQIKPDMASHGSGTYVIRVDSTIGQSSGTSFASPILAGLSACLWQAFPDMTNMEIRDVMYAASHQFSSPDTLLGYGIPDMTSAYESVLYNYSTGISEYYEDQIHTQLIGNTLTLSGHLASINFISVIDINGALIEKKKVNFRPSSLEEKIELKSLDKSQPHLRMVHIDAGINSRTIKVYK